MHFGHFEIRRIERQLLVAGQPVALGSRAFDLLLALSERSDLVVSKNELIALVWPGLVVEDNNLQVQISSLRKLLGREVIATIPGRGYQFTATATAADDGNTQSPRALPSVLPHTHAALALPEERLPGNLPDVLPLLYGREEDVTTLAAMLHAHHLVTLVGAGGIGKTSLAQAVSHRERLAWPDGAWLIELAPCTDPALVASVIAQTLGIKLLGSKSAQDEVVVALRGMTLLLVLDNCEHLLSSCAALATQVLAQASGVTLLATSQEPLHLADEQQFRLQPLAVPADATDANASVAGAVALFAARASRVDPRFKLSADNLEIVIEICRRLDGIALAIELAAARVPLLGVNGVRARLEDRFKVLTVGSRIALPRHQTLRAAVEWSYSLLSHDEQTVLCRLGVFVGSFGLSSAQHLIADERIDEWAALNHLGALVDKSWVAVESCAEPRYRLLETTRAFILERLHGGDDTARLLDRHADLTRALFERSMDEIWSVPLQVRLERYLPDLENLRAAMDWASVTPRAGGERRRGSLRTALVSAENRPVQRSGETLIALTAASLWLWRNAGLIPEGLRRYAEARECVESNTPPLLEARLTSARVMLDDINANSDDGVLCERVLMLYRALGDRQGQYLALTELVRLFAIKGELAASERALAETEQLLDESWTPLLRCRWARAKVYFLWGSDRLADAEKANDSLYLLATEAGDLGALTSSLTFRQTLAFTHGNLPETVTQGRELSGSIQSRQFPINAYLVRSNLSAALAELGQVDEALTTARACELIASPIGLLWHCLDSFALVAAKRGRAREAALTLCRSDAAYDEKLRPRMPSAQRTRDLTVTALQSAFGKAELQRLLTENATVSVEAAARIALAD